MEKAPRLIVRYFGPGPKQQWARMVYVLQHTARQHCPDWRLDIAAVDPADPSLYSQRGVQGHVWNTHKLDEWTRLVHEASDGERLLLLDADTFLTRPLDDVWSQAFDVAYTVKPNKETRRFPLNGGVIFLRVSDRARRFMDGWQAQNRAFLDDDKQYAVWSGCYGGINQAALGVYLRSRPELHVLKLPCLEWNCEDEHWAQFNTEITRIVHVKSALRDAILKMVKPDDDVRPLMNLWRSLEGEAMQSNGKPEVSEVENKQPAIERNQQNVEYDRQMTPESLRTPEDMQPATLNRAQRRRRQRKAQPA